MLGEQKREVKQKKGIDVTVKLKTKSSPFPSTEMSIDL
jgi:hypothetical protein